MSYLDERNITKKTESLQLWEFYFVHSLFLDKNAIFIEIFGIFAEKSRKKAPFFTKKRTKQYLFFYTLLF